MPDLPQGCAALWDIFLQLNGARSSSGFGMAAIGLSNVLAWQQLHDAVLSSWEVDTLLAIDRAVLAVVAAHEKTKTK